ESLVAFARVGDAVRFSPGGALAVEVRGPFAATVGAPDDNLVLAAARALAREVEGLALGRFTLDKNLPVAAGLGGGSADAAAAPAWLAALARGRNDLEPVALKLCPAVAEVIAALRRADGCIFARMSGSGATCFAAFASEAAATECARVLRIAQPGWWVEASGIGGGV